VRKQILTLPPKTRRFQLILIKPSHYDDDGYVIQWWRSTIPSNSLACVHSLAEDAAGRQVLGGDVTIDVTSIDEINTRIKPKRVLSLLNRHDGFGMVGFIGVQSNQFPRALDLARPLRAAGVQVVIGGFHVSGCLSMLPEMQADLKIALDLGCTLFAGEIEGRMDDLLQDAAARTLKPMYNYLNDLPALESTPTPHLPTRTLGRTLGFYASFDAGRGCPYQCSFCTIINVQGRKSRYRSPDDIEHLIRQHWSEGIRRYFITDDNFARNKNWEPIFDRLIELRERDKLDLKLIIQVDALCHKIPRFISKAVRAGVKRVFIGLENINPANLMAAKKRQNKITEYRTMLLEWKQAGVITYAGYILGFPFDTHASIQEDIEIIKNELPLDLIEFFVLTPLPGSEDHKVLWQKGVWMDPDMNKYDAEHVVTDHPKMTRTEWSDLYRTAWDAFYSKEHMETILRRGAASGTGLSRLIPQLLLFSSCVSIENVHPLQAGFFRLKDRRGRRPGAPIEPILTFYLNYLWETVSKNVRHAERWLWLSTLGRRIKREQRSTPYRDRALLPVVDSETETLDMFKHNDAARDAVAHQRKVAALIGQTPTTTECR
jgi:hypothetical protein